MPDQHKTVSKFLSLVLRHAPESIGLVLDEQGWADIDELITKAAVHGQHYSRELIAEIVAQSDKQRFRLSDDGHRIRANQGHSVAVDLGLAPFVPPATLCHGTATRFLQSIQQQGLLKQKRQYVHLSADVTTAEKVGVRHGKLVILEVAAGVMQYAGYLFYLSENGVWLTDHVPAKYLTEQV